MLAGSARCALQCPALGPLPPLLPCPTPACGYPYTCVQPWWGGDTQTEAAGHVQTRVVIEACTEPVMCAPTLTPYHGSAHLHHVGLWDREGLAWSLGLSELHLLSQEPGHLRQWDRGEG